MRRTFAAVLLSVLVVLAGCSGVFGEGGQPTETVTPAAVPTDKPTPTPVPQLTPGLTGEGIENPSALIAAHTSILRNKSFTVRSNSTVLASNGSVLVRNRGTLRAGKTGEGVYSVSKRNGRHKNQGYEFPVRTELWSNAELLFQNRTYANGTTVYERKQIGERIRLGASEAGLRYLLKPFGTQNTSVTKRERNGTTLYLVRGRTEENRSLRMLVDSRGIIHSYRTVQPILSNENVSRIISESRYSKVGATDAPERPSWVATAKNRTTPTAGSWSRTVG
jgi:hypothetical protein